MANAPRPTRREPVLRALQRLLARRALDFEADRDIVDRGLPGKQRIGLEQIAGVPVQAGQRLTENLHRPRGGLQQPGGDIEQRRFSAAGRADDGDELAIRHRQAGLLNGRIDASPATRKATVALSSATAIGCSLPAMFLPRIWRDALAVTKDKFNAAPFKRP